MVSIAWDYLVFAIFIFGSTIYPLWDEKRTRKEAQTKANYVFATGRVSMFAVMLSIARGTLGVRAFVGNLIKTYVIQNRCREDADYLLFYSCTHTLTYTHTNNYTTEYITKSISNLKQVYTRNVI